MSMTEAVLSCGQSKIERFKDELARVDTEVARNAEDHACSYEIADERIILTCPEHSDDPMSLDYRVRVLETRARIERLDNLRATKSYLQGMLASWEHPGEPPDTAMSLPGRRLPLMDQVT